MGDLIQFPTGKILEKDKRARCVCDATKWVIITEIAEGKLLNPSVECYECGEEAEINWT